MKTTDANRFPPGYELKDELARFCLRTADRDPNRKVIWVNSICILFLLIGILGAKPAAVPVKPVPPVEEAVPLTVEPLPPPPQTTPENQNQDQSEQEKLDAPQVVVVTPNAPNINFAVPTIGNLVAPSAMAQAPPLQPPAALKNLPTTLNDTGAGGERPQPRYPKIALEQAEQGTVTLLINADAAGNVTSIEVKESSGYPILDRSSVDYVKRHWTLPPGIGTRVFETSITYRLQTN